MTEQLSIMQQIDAAVPAEASASPFEPLSADDLNDLRMRVIKGYDPTPEEMQAVVQTMHMRRSTIASAQTGKSRKKPRGATKSPPPSLDDLL